MSDASKNSSTPSESGHEAGVRAAPVSKPPVTRKLDLACGQNVREGFEGVDIWPSAQHVVDLQHYPWPFENESVLEINCSHYIEHIPMEYMTVPLSGAESCGQRDGTAHDCYDAGCHRYKLKDSLFAFFDECWRILVPDGWMHITVPSHRSDRAFQDPTHRRFITQQTFAYMNVDVRRSMKVDHYNVDCHFIGDCHPVVNTELNLKHPEVATRMIQREWNTVVDWTAKLQKKFPPPK